MNLISSKEVVREMNLISSKEVVPSKEVVHQVSARNEFNI